MGSVCSCNDNDKIIEEAYQKRMRTEKANRLGEAIKKYYEEQVESGILTDEDEDEDEE